MPLAAALFCTVKWQPQWMHHNFLPVIGLRVHARYHRPRLLTDSWVALLAYGSEKRIEDSSVGPFYKQYSSTLVSRPLSQQWAHSRRKSKATPLILSTMPNRCIQARHPATRKRCLIASQVGTMGFFTGGTLAR